MRLKRKLMQALCSSFLLMGISILGTTQRSHGLSGQCGAACILGIIFGNNFFSIKTSYKFFFVKKENDI